MAPSHAVDGGGVGGEDGQLPRVSRRGRLEEEKGKKGGREGGREGG